jgi:hypothetical protein
VSVVTVVRICPVAVCVAVTVTPGKAPPSSSLTLPASEAVETACPRATPVKEIQTMRAAAQ